METKELIERALETARFEEDYQQLAAQSYALIAIAQELKRANDREDARAAWAREQGADYGLFHIPRES